MHHPSGPQDDARDPGIRLEGETRHPKLLSFFSACTIKMVRTVGSGIFLKHSAGVIYLEAQDVLELEADVYSVIKQYLES